jgi:DNA adenine methylase
MSYLGVIGSKTKAAEQLIAMMPPEAFGQCYIELFAGGAGVFFKKQAAKINVLNDADPDLATMHEAVRREPESVEAELRVLLDDDRTFQRLLALRDSEDWWNEPAARRAATVIYLHKASVNSNQEALSSSSKVRSSHNPEFDLGKFAEKLKRVQIRSLDWPTCVKKYLSGSPPVEAFVFADPPYVIADTRKHYRINFHPVEHIRFWHRMTELSKANGPDRNVKIMITYDDVSIIRALYREADGWRVTPLPIGYASAHDKGQARSEVVITNYDSSPPPTEEPDTVDWSDITHRDASLDGVPFEQLDCCDKERIGLVLAARSRCLCRVCGSKVTLK